MSRRRFDTRSAALVAVGVALAVGIALVASSGRGHAPRAARTPTPPRAPAPARPASRPPASAPTHAPSPPPGDAFPHTPAGAVAAATNWCQAGSQAFVNGTLTAEIDALATPSIRARFALAVRRPTAVVHAGLTAPGASPYVLRQWPLGYRVEQYSPSHASVVVWQLHLLETDQPEQSLGYSSETVLLQWMDGTWKYAGKRDGPNMTPPGRDASTAAITAWIEATDQLRSYSYAP